MSLPLLSKERVWLYPKVLLLGYALGAMIAYLRPRFLDTFDIRFPIADFICFYAAGSLALTGKPETAYDFAALHEVYTHVLPDHPVEGILGWYYPPTFFLPLHPLAMLDYYPALALWVCATAGLFAFALAPLLRSGTEAWIIAASAPVVFNAFAGQNGFLTSALIVFVFRGLPSRPLMAGIALGCLTYKPHFGILFLILAIAMRKWRVILYATLVALGLIAVSVLIHGTAPWVAFLTVNMKNLSALHGSVGSASMPKVSSVYYSALSLGVPRDAARIAQLAFVLICAAWIALMVRKRAPYDLVFAFTAAAALPAALHNFPYDWVMFVLPCLILWRHMEQDGELPLEKLTLLVMMFAIIPLLAFPSGSSVSPGVVVPLALLALLARRSLRALSPERQ